MKKALKECTHEELAFMIALQLGIRLNAVNVSRAIWKHVLPDAHELAFDTVSDRAEDGGCVNIQLYEKVGEGRIYSWGSCKIEGDKEHNALIIHRDGQSDDNEKLTYPLLFQPSHMTSDIFCTSIASAMFKHMAWTFKDKIIAPPPMYNER